MVWHRSATPQASLWEGSESLAALVIKPLHE